MGYPIINVPSGFVLNMPLGISFMGTAFSEPKLITLASGFEHVYPQRHAPRFLDSLPIDSRETAPRPGRSHQPARIDNLRGKRPARI